MSVQEHEITNTLTLSKLAESNAKEHQVLQGKTFFVQGYAFCLNNNADTAAQAGVLAGGLLSYADSVRDFLEAKEEVNLSRTLKHIS